LNFTLWEKISSLYIGRAAIFCGNTRKERQMREKQKTVGIGARSYDDKNPSGFVKVKEMRQDWEVLV